ncbi:MAG: V-type ATP synthase subunit D [Spirochaetaceae bacterium]|jgi:V/A-type H+-transporting ATPase subunit D|nr:V-type ATP synthase subunit D [Spirochaetaceae bacterium]
MVREAIAPTKSNLIHIKERLTIAEEGHDLLEQKREILVMELMRKIEQVKLLERELYNTTDEAYPALKRMLITTGRDKAERISRAITYQFSLKEHIVREAGISMPSLEVTMPSVELKYSMADSSAECDEITTRFFALLRTLTELAAVRTVAWRLAHEVRKTQRRVNALEKLVIPAAHETKVYIESALEEKDRDSFFTGKLLKKKKENRESRKNHDKATNF